MIHASWIRLVRSRRASGLGSIADLLLTRFTGNMLKRAEHITSLVPSLLHEQRGREHLVADRLEGRDEDGPLKTRSVFFGRVPVRREFLMVGLSSREVDMRV